MVKVKDTLTRKKIARAERHAALKARPCKHCGKPIGTIDKRQVVCSKECGFRSRTLQRVTVQCVVCCKPVIRTASHAKQFKAACCSDECQQIWAGRCGKGKKTGMARKARKRWKLAFGFARKKNNSVSFQWWKLCNQEFIYDNKLDQWDRKCGAASTLLGQRAVLHKQERFELCNTSWSAAAIQQFRELKSRTIRRSGNRWNAKFASVARNIKHRLVS